MSELPRLVQSSMNRASRRLLETGLQSQVPADTAKNLAAALGLHAASAAAVAGAGHVEASAALGSAPSGLSWLLGVGSKGLLLGALVGAVSSGAYWVVSDDEGAPAGALTEHLAPPTELRTEPAAAEPGAPGSSMDSPGSSSDSLEIPEATPGTPVDRLKREAALHGRAAPAAPATVEATPTPRIGERDSALAEETRLIDSARRALTANELGRAATLLGRYDATKVLGVLDREALVLRVELAGAQGDWPRARELAARYEQTYPGDAHILRLRARFIDRPGAETR